MDTEPLADVRDMYLAHTMYRREIGLAPALIRGVADGDVERAALIAEHLDLVVTSLDHHHRCEDDHLWQRLEAPANQVRSAHAASIESGHWTADELGVGIRQRSLRGVVLTEAAYPAESIITFDDIGVDTYFAHLPVTGRVESRYRGVDVTASREVAMVHQPAGGALYGRWAAGTHARCARACRADPYRPR